MDYFANHRYWLLRWMLNFIGLWPLANERSQIITFSFLILFLSVTFGLLIKCIIIFPNIELIAHTLTYSNIVFIICISYLCCYCNTSKMKELWVRIECDWKELEKTNRSFIADWYAAKTNLLSLFVLIFIFLYTVFGSTELILPALLDIISPLNRTRSNKSPFSIDLLESYKKLNFLVAVITSLLIMLIGTTMILILSEFFVFVLHACLLFSLVGDVLERGLVPVERGDATDDDKIFHERIAESVRYHVAAIRFTKLIDEIYNVICLIIMINVIIMLSTSSLHLFYTVQSRDLTTIIVNVLSMLCLIGTTFVITHAGQLVIDHSLEVFDKVCTMPWYQLSIKMQKLLAIILLRSKISSFITHGKMAILAHGLFTTLLHNAISFATVFISIR